MNVVDVMGEGTSPLQYLVVAGYLRRLQGDRPNFGRVKVLETKEGITLDLKRRIDGVS